MSASQFYNLSDLMEESPEGPLSQEEEPPLALKSLRDNIKRVKRDVDPYYDMAMWVKGVLYWNRPFESFIIFLVSPLRNHPCNHRGGRENMFLVCAAYTNVCMCIFIPLSCIFNVSTESIDARTYVVFQCMIDKYVQMCNVSFIFTAPSVQLCLYSIWTGWLLPLILFLTVGKLTLTYLDVL